MLRGSRGFAPHCTAPLRAGRRKPYVCRLFCVPARRYGHSLGKLHPYPAPPPRAGRRQPPLAPPCSLRRSPTLRPAFVTPSERTRQTGRRPARSAHVAAAIGYTFPPSAQGVSARKREAGGKRAGRSKKQGVFVGKCGENHGKRGAFSRLCGIHSAYKPSPCDDRAGKKKRSALFLQRKRADRSVSGHCARRRRILVSDEVTTAQRLG